MKGLATISFCLILLSTGCSEVIDLGTSQQQSQILIFGRITSGLEGNLIEIARTSPVNSEQLPISDAEVYVVSGDGEREEYSLVAPGRYQLFNQSLIGQPGQTYHLEISLADGSRYESIPATMPERVGADFIDFETKSLEIQLQNNRGTVRRNVVEFYVTTEVFEPEEDHYMRWNLVETYLFPERPQMVFVPDPPPPWCYITYDLEEQQVFLYNGLKSKTPEIGRRLFTTRLADNSFVSEYYLQVVQSSLTPDAYRFWDELDEVTNSQGTIFDRPMGPVVGNLYNVNDRDEDVLGYFEVSQVDTSRIMLRAEDLPEFDIRLPCPIVGQVGPECYNCLILNNSVKVKPHFVD